MENYINRRVRYYRVDDKPELCADITGTIVELHLKAKGKYRKHDIYRVEWDNGKTGLVELEDRGLTFENKED